MRPTFCGEPPPTDLHCTEGLDDGTGGILWDAPLPRKPETFGGEGYPGYLGPGQTRAHSDTRQWFLDLDLKSTQGCGGGPFPFLVPRPGSARLYYIIDDYQEPR